VRSAQHIDSGVAVIQGLAADAHETGRQDMLECRSAQIERGPAHRPASVRHSDQPRSLWIAADQVLAGRATHGRQRLRGQTSNAGGALPSGLVSPVAGSGGRRAAGKIDLCRRSARHGGTAERE